MNREIEEMANTLYGYSIDTKEDCEFVAKLLYANDYRKSTDVAREIFADIEQHLEKQIKAILMFGKDDDDFYSGELHALNVLQNYIKAVKKKYESEGADDE